MRLSRALAVIIGVLAPLLDTVRRWSTWQEFPPSLIDDYILGAFLIFGAWLAGRSPERGRLVLAAAWGFTCGMGLASFFGQLHRLLTDEADPAPIPSLGVAIIKGVGLGLAVVALILTIASKRADQFRRDAGRDNHATRLPGCRTPGGR